ncbi:hypothetical protein BG015_002863 [Linnemannia schmuckeri]|uniref:Phosphatidylglycerol/phosphatidylinositol transfer protein n=1 Tax=Linnemannia schmuckeri TaxID=64567 RepID=A0A9P5S983_9FUNG|nr:hypothetical protein BG015_002863 [Linnemannia schmuckeri]
MKASTSFVSAFVLFGITEILKVSAANCASGPTDMTVTSFGYTPNPLMQNQQACHNAVGTLSVPVVGGAKLALVGRYLGRVVYTDNHDYCTLLALDGLPCPVPTTATSLHSCYLIKPSVPLNITFNMQWIATNANGNMIYCQSFDVKAHTYPFSTTPIHKKYGVMKLLLIFFSILAWFALLIQGQVVFTNCAVGATDMTVTSFSISPYPMCVGKTLCLTASGTLNTNISSGGTLTGLGKYLGRVIYSATFDFCVLSSSNGQECEVMTPNTTTQLTICFALKPDFPIPVIIRFEATNGNGHVIFCQTVSMFGEGEWLGVSQETKKK